MVTEEREFKSVSLRDSLLKQVKDFISENPVFVENNPEYNSVAGFIDQATRVMLNKLKTQLDGAKPMHKLPNAEEA